MRNNLILIASADRNWGLGKDNKLLKRIPEDLKRFSELTRGNAIVVGRKTLESFKDKKPLPDRINIVLTKDKDYACEDAVIVHSIKELINTIKELDKNIYVCGGETIYKQLLPYCGLALITQIDEEYEADTYLVNLDNNSDWKKTVTGEWQESRAGVRFRYVEYIKSEHN
ncbi:MAG TPA: dihydrofolate reductase [Clostridiaceae bacterium]|jgi:dihydrofolate reductase|nr:dihydrofolate reductase [Clostridiaceae bacterium]